MSTVSVTSEKRSSEKRSALWRPVFLELTVVFVGLVVYAVLTSINQRASLLAIMIASLTEDGATDEGILPGGSQGAA